MEVQVRQNLEKANEKVYGKGKVFRFDDGQPAAKNRVVGPNGPKIEFQSVQEMAAGA